MRARWLVLISLVATLSLVFGKARALPAEGIPPSAHPYAFDVVQHEAQGLFAKGLFHIERLLASSIVSHDDQLAAVRNYFTFEQQWNARITSARGSRQGSNQDLEQLGASIGADSLEKLRSIVEDVIEHQIDSILNQQDIDVHLPLTGTQIVFPPVRFDLEKPPNLLVTSPRSEIKLLHTWLLTSNMTEDQMAAIEKQAEGDGVSAEIEPIGGLATYPAIVAVGDTLKNTLIDAAHEWTHAYLYLHPLGRLYGSNYNMTIINEMVATMVGNEVGQLAYQQYYGAQSDARATPRKSTINFNQEMRTIRKTVDDYLAKGQIAEAESYMAERRDFLAANGYNIRKLNQAYLAFHSSYADSPTATSPAQGYLKDLRDRSGSLANFLNQVSQIRSYADLAKLAG